jgi:predicted RNA-binding Zn-ribbon protein involved in translation (DUF1610 family)
MGKNNIDEWFERFGQDQVRISFSHARVKPVVVEKVTDVPATKKDVLRCASCGAKMKLVRTGSKFGKLTASCPDCGGTASSSD